MDLSEECQTSDFRRVAQSSDNREGKRNRSNIKRLIQRFSTEFMKKYENLKETRSDILFESRLLEFIHFYRTRNHLIETRDVGRIMRISLPLLIFEMQVSDSDLVAEFLLCMGNRNAECCTSIDLFLMSAMNRGGDGRSDEDILNHEPSTSSYSYLSFFLHHANEKRLTFGGRRLTQIPWDNGSSGITTLLYTRPQSVLTFLQYEARFFGENDSWNDKSQWILACAFEFILFCGVTTGLWTPTLSTMLPKSEFSPYMKKMLHNFRLLLRTVHNPHVATYRLANMFVGPHTIRLPPSDRLRQFFAASLPDLDLVSMKAPSLKHLCRLVIRWRLYDNWQLPDAIYELGLPQLLAHYVNLYE